MDKLPHGMANSPLEMEHPFDMPSEAYPDWVTQEIPEVALWRAILYRVLCDLGSAELAVRDDALKWCRVRRGEGDRALCLDAARVSPHNWRRMVAERLNSLKALRKIPNRIYNTPKFR